MIREEGRAARTGARSQKPEGRNQKAGSWGVGEVSEARKQKPEARNRKPEGRSQKRETSDQRPEVRSFQMSRLAVAGAVVSRSLARSKSRARARRRNEKCCSFSGCRAPRKMDQARRAFWDSWAHSSREMWRNKLTRTPLMVSHAVSRSTRMHVRGPYAVWRQTERGVVSMSTAIEGRSRFLDHGRRWKRVLSIEYRAHAFWHGACGKSHCGWAFLR